MATNATQLARSGKFGDLQRRLVFLLLALVVYRIGAHIPVPGINPDQLEQLFKGQQGGILNLFNMFSGGALSRFTVFALGIMPYISSSIIMQLLTIMSPKLKAMYQEYGRELRNLQSPQFFSPLGPERKVAIVTFIKDAEALDLEKAARQGKVGARWIRAGFCVKNSTCPYGGHEAIAHCLGGDDGKGCPDLLVDITKKREIMTYEKVIDDQLKIVHPDSPRHNRLQAEKRAIRKYYEIVKAEDR